MFTDRTDDFRAALQAAQKNPKNARKTRSSSGSSGGKEREFLKQYLTEAYAILDHILSLSSTLKEIRQSYLNVDKRTFRPDLQKSRTGTRGLTDEDRDQFDIQSRVILTRCADRVKGLEELEKRRQEVASNRDNTLSRLLSFQLAPVSGSTDCIAVHHSNISWYLGRRLAEMSQAQREMQEQRVKRQMERTHTLGSGALREAALPSIKMPSLALLSKTTAPTAGPSSALGNGTFSEGNGHSIELSPQQIQQFEEENQNILHSVQNTLESVQQAESRLVDISALQMELVARLTQQTELTDQLYDDAVSTVSSMDKSTAQLREARRRMKDSRLFILVFFMGASFSLLFLHYY